MEFNVRVSIVDGGRLRVSVSPGWGWEDYYLRIYGGLRRAVLGLVADYIVFRRLGVDGSLFGMDVYDRLGRRVGSVVGVGCDGGDFFVDVRTDRVDEGWLLWRLRRGGLSGFESHVASSSEGLDALVDAVCERYGASRREALSGGYLARFALERGVELRFREVRIPLGRISYR